MTEENNSLISSIKLDLSEQDIVELVQGIKQSFIIDLVKHNKYLRQHVFHGFRPDHLPWAQVPVRIAQDALGHPERVETLLKLWQQSNNSLVQEVADLPVENVPEGIVELLIRHGLENRGKIIWALRLDNRAEIQDMLKQDILQELSGEATTLMSRTLSAILENTQKQLAQAQDELEKQRRLLQHKNEQVDEWQKSYEEAVIHQKQLQARIAEFEAQQQVDQNTLHDLEHQLQSERTTVQELRRSLVDLKTTLRRQAEEEDVSKVLLELEEERKLSAGLRLKLEKLEQQRGDAYAKRDQVLEQIEIIRQKLEQAQRDKNVIVDQKRQLSEQLEKLQIELKELRSQHDDQAYQHLMEAIPVANLEVVWLDARNAIREHLRSIATMLGENQTCVPVDKITSWRKWMTKELKLVEELLATIDAYPGTMILPNQAQLREVQQLLMLRWYLLEYTRLAIEHIERETILPI